MCKNNSFIEYYNRKIQGSDLLKNFFFIKTEKIDPPASSRPFDIKQWLEKAAEVTNNACGNSAAAHVHMAQSFPMTHHSSKDDYSFLGESIWDKIIFQEGILSSYAKTRKFIALRYPQKQLDFTRLVYQSYLFDIYERWCGVKYKSTNNPNEIVLNEIISYAKASRLPLMDKESKIGLYYLYKKNNNSFKFSDLRDHIFDAEDESTFTTGEISKVKRELQMKELNVNPYFSSGFKTLAKKLNSDIKNSSSLLTSTSKLWTNENLCSLHLLEFSQITVGKHIESSEPTVKNYTAGGNSILKAFTSPRFAYKEYVKLLENYNHMIADLDFTPLHNQTEPLRDKLGRRKKPIIDFAFIRHLLTDYAPEVHLDNDIFSGMELADKVYSRYLIDKTFPVSAVVALFNQLSAFEENPLLKYFLHENLSAISGFSRLPNVFSRDLILKIFVDSLSSPVSEPDPTAPTHTTSEYNQQNQQVLNSFVSSINILQRILIPMWNNHFFNVLLESIKGDESFEYTIERLFEYLSIYLNDHECVDELLFLDGIYFSEASGKDYGKNYIAPFSTKLGINPDIDYALFKKCMDAVYKNGLYDFAQTNREVIPDFLNSSTIANVVSLSSDIPAKIRDLFYKGSI